MQNFFLFPHISLFIDLSYLTLMCLLLLLWRLPKSFVLFCGVGVHLFGLVIIFSEKEKFLSPFEVLIWSRSPWVLWELSELSELFWESSKELSEKASFLWPIPVMGKGRTDSVVKVQILSKGFKKRIYWEQSAGKRCGCVGRCVCVYGGIMTLLTVLMFLRCCRLTV